MDITLIEILYYLILVDSIGALGIAYFGRRWYLQHLGFAAQWFPPAKGWATLYFLLAILLVLTLHGIAG